MTFYIQGLNNHESMSIEQLFVKPTVKRVLAADSLKPISKKDHDTDLLDHQHHSAVDNYQVINQLPKNEKAIFAEQIMSPSVITLPLNEKISNALKIFKNRSFRHLPIVTSDNRLAGIISDRDVLYYLSAISNAKRKQTSLLVNDEVSKVMKSRVLTASHDTDVRYIARLFVEQHVGAMPIVSNKNLIGIVTRSDILRAVMRHFVFELWA